MFFETHASVVIQPDLDLVEKRNPPMQRGEVTCLFALDKCILKYSFGQEKKIRTFYDENTLVWHSKACAIVYYAVKPSWGMGES